MLGNGCSDRRYLYIGGRRHADRLTLFHVPQLQEIG